MVETGDIGEREPAVVQEQRVVGWGEVLDAERSRINELVGSSGEAVQGGPRSLTQDKEEALGTISGIREQIAKGGSSYLGKELADEERRLQAVEARISSAEGSLATLDRFQRYFEETPKLIAQRNEIEEAISGLKEQIEVKGGIENAGPLREELRNEVAWLSRTNAEVNALEDNLPRESREVLEANQREAEETIKEVEEQIGKGGSSHLQKELAKEQRRLDEINGKLELLGGRDKSIVEEKSVQDVSSPTEINPEVIGQLIKIAKGGVAGFSANQKTVSGGQVTGNNVLNAEEAVDVVGNRGAASEPIEPVISASPQPVVAGGLQEDQPSGPVVEGTAAVLQGVGISTETGVGQAEGAPLTAESQKKIGRLRRLLGKAVADWWKSLPPPGRNKGDWAAWGLGVAAGFVESMFVSDVVPGMAAVKGIANVALINSVNLGLKAAFTSESQKLITQIEQAQDNTGRQALIDKMTERGKKYGRAAGYLSDFASGLAVGSIVHAAYQILSPAVEAAIHAVRPPIGATTGIPVTPVPTGPEHVTSVPKIEMPDIRAATSVATQGTREAGADLFAQKIRIPGGSWFWKEAEGPVGRWMEQNGIEGWINPENGVTARQSLVGSMIKMLRQNGVEIDIVQPGTEFDLGKLLTPVQQETLVKIANTRSVADYVSYYSQLTP
ncbi:MAG TPA: hypothetical protein VMW04_00860 [Patescibacteria group bacterium]|nr:hypothetical protein [Patescibacteria group bacterium]